MKTLRILLMSLPLCSLPVLASAAPPAPVAAEVAQGPRKTAISRADEQGLEKRQAQSKDLEKYEGGQVVIAISTVGAVVIGLILLLILL
jgi:hypothetical protein